jgi:hypothetical protein
VKAESTPDWHRYVLDIRAEANSSSVDAAILALSPLIEETALRVCRRRMVREQLRRDFIAGSVSALVAPRESRDGTRRPPRISDFDSAEGPFTAWLFAVLDNLLKDLLRTTARRGMRETVFSTISDSPDIIEFSAHSKHMDPGVILDRTSPFTKRDLERLETWPALDRILVLAVFQLDKKISLPTWDSWCQQAELPTPFPPEHTIPHERGEWINLIAELLVASPNALQNRIRRRLEQLRTDPLDYIRDIQNAK